jgi:hypothetical protein
METSPPPKRPWAFLIAVIVASVVISAIVMYLGITGAIGGGIPGTQPPHHSLIPVLATLGGS